MKIPAARILKILAALCTVAAVAAACCKVEPEPEVKERVLLFYGAGYNNLSSDIAADIDQLCSSDYIPEKNSGNVLLVFQNLAEKNYLTPYTPVLYRVYRNNNGETVKKTLLTLEPGTVAASASTLNRVLSHVKASYISDSFGMIFSSHATGWLPAAGNTKRPLGKSASPSSIGNEYSPETGTKVQYEMDLDDFADAIPMHLDYILFDACFMGGVEVAYELKDVCDRVAFSQAEVLADGFDYTTMTEYLLKSAPDLEGVCRAYYEHYDKLTGVYRSATVSLVECSRMDRLAQVCKEIYGKHRDELDSIDPKNVQCFGRQEYPEHQYFYDLEDIMNQLTLDQAEKEQFGSALDECVIYAATTGRMVNLNIDKFCGLSSYCTNRFTYDDFYRTLSWNQATGMIQ